MKRWLLLHHIDVNVRFLPELAAEAAKLSRKKCFVTWTGCYRPVAGNNPKIDRLGGVKVCFD